MVISGKSSENHGEPTLLLILKRACLVHKIWRNTLLLIEQYIYYRSVGCHSCDSPFLKILFVRILYNKVFALSLNCWYKFPCVLCEL